MEKWMHFDGPYTWHCFYRFTVARWQTGNAIVSSVFVRSQCAFVDFLLCDVILLLMKSTNPSQTSVSSFGISDEMQQRRQTNKLIDLAHSKIIYGDLSGLWCGYSIAVLIPNERPKAIAATTMCLNVKCIDSEVNCSSSRSTGSIKCVANKTVVSLWHLQT